VLVRKGMVALPPWVNFVSHTTQHQDKKLPEEEKEKRIGQSISISSCMRIEGGK